MTEIPVFPAGAPHTAIPEPGGGFNDVMASLSRAIAGLGAKLPDPQRIRFDKSQNVYPVSIDPVPMTITAGAGVLDVTQLFGPTLGHHWDIHLISATGFTAGTVQGWKNLPAGGPATALQGALRAPFTSAGVLTFGKNHLPLRYGDRLVFIAAGITLAPGQSQVLISFEATGMTDPYVGEYLI